MLGSISQITINQIVANRSFLENVMNLTTLIEGINSIDGSKAKIQRIKIFIRSYCLDDEGDGFYAMQPLVVQTI
jgi:hypothetical protein